MRIVVSIRAENCLLATKNKQTCRPMYVWTPPTSHASRLVTSCSRHSTPLWDRRLSPFVDSTRDKRSTVRRTEQNRYSWQPADTVCVHICIAHLRTNTYKCVHVRVCAWSRWTLSDTAVSPNRRRRFDTQSSIVATASANWVNDWTLTKWPSGPYTVWHSRQWAKLLVLWVTGECV